MASSMGFGMHKNTISRLHGYRNALLAVRSPVWIHLMSSRLFSTCAGALSSTGLRTLLLDTLARILISGLVLWVKQTKQGGRIWAVRRLKQ